ncbi:hypothetical protein [Luethyella okanaganae]|uniref:Uncharacterized protein n=1 Tax=Luethyella okanaganae TaxID=69372 RepID=A0ABW1VD61_9MICO
MTRHSDHRALLALVGAVAACAIGAATVLTAAGFMDSTFAGAKLSTETASLTIAPVPYDQTFGSVLYLNEAGEVYLGGNRAAGDGAGSIATAASAAPTKVAFPSDVRIVNAIGSTNDFDRNSRTFTSYMALDSHGKVWTWGKPWNTTDYLGRGKVSDQQAATPGVVSQTQDGGALPAIVSIRRIENQFIALDNDGTMWAWGLGNENLPIVGPDKKSYAYPIKANSTTAKHGYNVRCDSGPDALGTVKWRSIWSGTNVDGAVAQNGLIYTWGLDNADALTGAGSNDTCPTISEGLNRALFQKYPTLYLTASSASYDEQVLTTEEARHQRYLDIVTAMKDKTLKACAGVSTGIVIDDSGCPVRQLVFSARQASMLTSDQELYTVHLLSGWSINELLPMLGRPADTDARNIANYAFAPRKVVFDSSAKVRSIGAGIGHFTVILTDGSVWGWGINTRCQALGVHTGVKSGESCSTWQDDIVKTPTRIDGLSGLEAASLSSAACSTWVTSTTGAVYAWGGGTLSGRDFWRCDDNGALGYKIYDYSTTAPNSPFSNPVADVSTKTRKIFSGGK